jgi:hypothetical protein
MTMGMYRVDVRADGDDTQGNQQGTASNTDATLTDPEEIPDPKPEDPPYDGTGRLILKNAYDFSRNTAYYSYGDEDEFDVTVEYLPEGAEEFQEVYLDEDEVKGIISADIPSGCPVRFTVTHNAGSTWDTPSMEVDGQKMGLEYRKCIWEASFDEQKTEVECDLVVDPFVTPIETLTVEDQSYIEGDYRDREIWENDQPTGEYYKGYHTWPENMYIKLKDGQEYSGEAGEVKEQLAGHLKVYEEDLFDYWEEFDQPFNAETLITEWGIGSHPVKLHVLGEVADYNVVVTENPIKEIKVSDIRCYEGDYEDREIWEDDHPTGEYYKGYRTWPDYVYVKLTDDTEFSGEAGDVKRKLAEHFNTPENQFDFWEDFDQPYNSETMVTEWGKGEHECTLHILGKTASYNVIVESSPIASIEVGNFNVMAGDYEDRDIWVDGNQKFVKAYNTWPGYVKVTLADEDNTVYEGEPDDVRRKLAAKFGYDDPWSMPYGDNFNESQEYDENNVTTWDKGEHTVKFSALGAECSYVVTVVDVPIDTMTQAGNIKKFDGETENRNGYHGPDAEGQHVDDDTVEWQAYNINPQNLTVTFTDESEPITGDCWYVKDKICERYNVRLSDRFEGDTQSPYNSWGVGLYHIKFWLGTACAEYDVIIGENPIVSVSVEDFDKLMGDTREEHGFEDPETHQWNDKDPYQIYDPWPKQMTVTLSESYAAEYGGDTISGDPNDVRRDLMELLGIEDERDIDFRWESDQSPYNVWDEPGTYPVQFVVCGVRADYNVKLIANPIKSVTVANKSVLVGDTYTEHGWWDEATDTHHDIDWERYNSWPDKVTVTLENGTVLTGNPELFHEELSQIAGVDVEYRQNDPQKPVEQGEGYVSDWTVGGTYTCSFSVGGVVAEYKVSVIDSPILSIEVPYDEYVWAGDTYEEFGYDNGQGWVDKKWQRYGYWPGTIKVNIADVGYVTLEGGHEEMAATLAEYLEVEPEEINIQVRDDQRPDENGMTQWTVGDHEADVSIAGKHATLKVHVVDLGIKSVEVEKLYRDYEDIVPMGYEDPVTHEWIDYPEGTPDEDKFQGYNFFPEKVIITFNDNTVVETEDPFSFARELQNELGVPDYCGIHVYVTADQNPDNEWGIGYHTATLEFGQFRSEYDVVITGPKGNYTGLAEDLDEGDNYYYYEDGFLSDEFSGFVKTAVAKVVGRLGEDSQIIEGSEGWWLVDNGSVDITTGPEFAEGIINGKKAVYKVTNGKYDPQFTGFAKEGKDSYYFEKGIWNKVDKKLAYNPADEKWYYVTNGKMDLTFTGLAPRTSGGWYFARNGVGDDTYTGLALATNNHWYYCKNGKLDKSFDGKISIATNGKLYYVRKGSPTKNFDEKIAYCPGDGKWYLCTDGRPNLKYSGKLAYCTTGEYYYVTKGLIDRSFTGVAEATNGIWYYCRKGKLDKTFTGVSKATDGTYKYVKEGKYNTKYKGLARLSSGKTLYYVSNGTIDRSFTGTCKFEGKTYNVVKGVAK